MLPKLCDRLILGGILFLILFTPLAFGSVHPWAYILMEVVIFGLCLVWMVKLVFSSQPLTETGPPDDRGQTQQIVLPLLLFVGLVCFQLVPLPAALLQLLSPATYEVYSQSHPGWPEQVPYEEFTSHTAPVQAVFSTWRPLSLAPQLTRTDLLKFLAYVAFFALVLLYPFESLSHDKSPRRLWQIFLLTVLCSGLLVACLGIAQLLTWNGKILWFFVPYDWGSPRSEMLRASGPFIAPGPFANYLALLFPLALLGSLTPDVFVSPPKRRGFRLGCGGVTVVLFMALLLSLSRAGWAAAAVGTGIFLAGFLALPSETRPLPLQGAKTTAVRFSILGFTVLLAFALFFVGPAGRRAIDVRLEQTVTQTAGGIGGRTAVLGDSLAMVQDFPLFGVGLGAWPELFPRYQRPPWSELFDREVHNDYIELVAETGLVGFCLLAWFFGMIGKRLLHGLATVSPKSLSILVALVAGIGAMAFHESLDFSLQIPANALLFTLFVGIALKLAGVGTGLRAAWPQLYTAGGGVMACVLLVAALDQARVPYPHNFTEPASIAEAKAQLLLYPAQASPHVALFHLRTDIPLAQRLNELQIASWLDPYNPKIRDLYAASLLYLGRQEEGLAEMTRSVAFAPDPAYHWYLDGKMLSRVSQKEQQAAEEGLLQALAKGYAGIVPRLGSFYSSLDRFADRAKLYEAAAHREKRVSVRFDHLMTAGHAYSQAGQYDKAEVLLRSAVELAQQNPKPYHELMSRVFVPQRDIHAVKDLVQTGIERGADPVALYAALATAARTMQEREEEKAALQKILALQPYSYEAHAQLGQLYMHERNYGQAALSWRKAIESQPYAAGAFYQLGLAEERLYRFFEAERAYAKAVELAPDNAGFRRHYEAFRQKVAANVEPEG